MPSDNVFGQALRAARTRSGFSQRQLALKLGAIDKYVSQWETGSWVPRGKWLAAIVAYYPSLAHFSESPATGTEKNDAPSPPTSPALQISNGYADALDALYAAGDSLGKAQERFCKARIALDREYHKLCTEIAGQVKP